MPRFYEVWSASRAALGVGSGGDSVLLKPTRTSKVGPEINGPQN